MSIVLVDYPSFVSPSEIPADIFRNATSEASGVAPANYALVQRYVEPHRRVRVEQAPNDHMRLKEAQRHVADGEVVFFIPDAPLSLEEQEMLRTELNVHAKSRTCKVRQVMFPWKRNPSSIPSSSPTSDGATACTAKPAGRSAGSSSSPAVGRPRGSRGASTTKSSSLRTTCVQ